MDVKKDHIYYIEVAPKNVVGNKNALGPPIHTIYGVLPELGTKKQYKISQRGCLIIGTIFLLCLTIFLSTKVYIDKLVYYPKGANYPSSIELIALNSMNKVTGTPVQPEATETASLETTEVQNTEINRITEKVEVTGKLHQEPKFTQPPEPTDENRTDEALSPEPITEFQETQTDKVDYGDKKTTQEEPIEPAFPLIITNKQWRGPKLNKSWCAKYVISDIIVVDNLKVHGCNSKEACVKILQDNQPLDSNFFIGNDGHVYENRGWNCLSNIKQDIYSLNHFKKITFIGHGLTKLQKKVFNSLINDGIQKVVLREKNYQLLAKCEGTDHQIYKLLKRSHHYRGTCVN